MASSERRLLIATNNRDKLREIKAILSGLKWEVLGLSDIPAYREPEEDGLTLLENAFIKAREGFRRSGILTVADDTGLEVDALNGEPGVYSSRFAGLNATYEDNVNLLLERMKGRSHRIARFRTVMALVGSDVEESWEGSTEGLILTEKRGQAGFGYDPVFWSPWLQKSFAEATLEEKNSVSHRFRALYRLKTVLDVK